MGWGEVCKTIHVNHHHKQLKWSKQVSPVLTVSSGDIVSFDTLDSSNGQFNKDSSRDSINQFDLTQADPIFGPVYVQDAQPGDALRVDILGLETADWGWTAIVPGFGLMAEDYPKSDLKIWKFDPAEGYAELKAGVRVPLRPFLGIMGVAPAADGEFSTIPPTDAGGNMDCRDFIVGTSLYLPVQVAGALFSCGDGHAAQGQGEICGTAIETPMKATVRLTVCKDHPWVTSPHFQTPPEPPFLYSAPDLGRYTTMGVDSDLLQATKKAVRAMIRWLVETKGLTANEAYILTSVAADLKMAQVVDINYGITLSIALNIFNNHSKTNGA